MTTDQYFRENEYAKNEAVIALMRLNTTRVYSKPNQICYSSKLSTKTQNKKPKHISHAFLSPKRRAFAFQPITQHKKVHVLCYASKFLDDISFAMLTGTRI